MNPTLRFEKVAALNCFDADGHRLADQDAGGGEAHEGVGDGVAGGFVGDDQHRGAGVGVAVLAHAVDGDALVAKDGGDLGERAGFVHQGHAHVEWRGGSGSGGGGGGESAGRLAEGGQAGAAGDLDHV